MELKGFRCFPVNVLSNLSNERTGDRTGDRTGTELMKMGRE